MAVAPTFTTESAQIIGQLFENRRMGVPRGVYWSCNIDFASFAEDWPCTLLCDWITWPVRSWREISGLTLEHCVGPVKVEPTLYFFGQHQWLSRIELSFQRSRADCFRVRGRFVADLEDLDGNVLQGTTGDIDVEAQFVGLSVLPDNLVPKPKLEAQAVEALRQYADLGSYERPRWDGNSWLFRPRVDDRSG
jgi:hypothetical protein